MSYMNFTSTVDEFVVVISYGMSSINKCYKGAKRMMKGEEGHVYVWDRRSHRSVPC